MDKDHFQSQISRLNEAFEQKYPKVRLEAIWYIVKDLPNAWFSRIIQEFIISSRQPPMVPDFSEQAKIERERAYLEQKHLQEAQAQDFWRGTYMPDDVRNITQTILKRIQGTVTDDYFAQFRKHLEQSINHTIPRPMCVRCEGTGLVFVPQENRSHIVYKCNCPYGEARGEKYAYLN